MNRSTDYQQYKVLYVDDEEQALKYFRKAFEKEFGVLTASSAAAASDLLREQGDSIAVLLTDQRMPERTGVDLLQEVRAEHPEIVRILTTAYSDLDSAIEAVNSGAIFRYVQKPWDLRELRGTLMRAIDFYHVQHERDLLLCEKLSVLQRMLVLDRARTLTVLGGGLQGRLRHPLHAVQAYLEFASARPELTSGPFAAGWDDLWALTLDESEMMLASVNQMLQATQPNGFAPVDVTDVLATDALAPHVQGRTLHAAADGAPTVIADAAMLRHLVTQLVRWLGQLETGGERINVEARDDAGGVRLTVTSDGPGWQHEHILTLLNLLGRPSGSADASTDLLTAYLIVLHHGGSLRIHASAPEGPGFEVRLPRDAGAVALPPLPEDWLATVFGRFEV